MIKGTAHVMAGLALLAGGCGYPYYYDVEVYDPGYDYGVSEECSSCDEETLQVELSWEVCSFGCANLDLELITPEGDRIDARHEDYYGCTHLGDDRGDGGSGYEEIVCMNPVWGSYEIRVVNREDEPIHADVWATYTTGSWSYSDVYDFGETVEAPARGTAIVEFELP